MQQAGTRLKPRSIQFGRPLLAWRPATYRGIDKHRALFVLHTTRPQIIAAWHRGDTLDAAKAQQLWAAHDWKLIAPPADAAPLLAKGAALTAAPRSR